MIAFVEDAALSASAESSDEESEQASEITLSTMRELSCDGQSIRTDLNGTVTSSDAGILQFRISTVQDCVNENVWFRLDDTNVWNVYERDTWSMRIDQDVTNYFEEHFVKSECSKFWFVFLEDAV